VSLAGITRHPDEFWMQQIARNATDEGLGYLNQRRYVLHDRDTKFCASFRTTLAAGGIKAIVLPARSPNLNAYAERWVLSVKQECLSKLILFGEGSLRRALSILTSRRHTVSTPSASIFPNCCRKTRFSSWIVNDVALLLA
jgi:putative transposase